MHAENDIRLLSKLKEFAARYGVKARTVERHSLRRITTKATRGQVGYPSFRASSKAMSPNHCSYRFVMAIKKLEQFTWSVGLIACSYSSVAQGGIMCQEDFFTAERIMRAVCGNS